MNEVHRISPYSCLPPLGTRLSPILEEDEKSGHSTTSLGKSEVNNSSQDCGLIPSPHRVSRKERNVVESSSGRRLASVEVLKQKYINNDILLPRHPKDDKYNRSRSSRLITSWPPGIHRKINRLIRRHSVTLGMASSIDQELDRIYRCQKFDHSLAEPAPEYETIDQDEYEQELLALIDKTDDDVNTDYCPADLNMHSGHEQERKTERPVSHEFSKRRFKDYDNDTEAKEAFIRGFLEGLRRTEKIGNELYSKFIEMIDCQKIIKEPTTDLVLQENNVVKMIENNQNVTHRFLTEWENENLGNSGSEISEKGNLQEFKSPFSDFSRHNASSRNSIQISRSLSESKVTPVDMINATETQNVKSKDKIEQIRGFQSEGNLGYRRDRQLLSISKTNIDFDSGENNVHKALHDEETVDKSPEKTPIHKSHEKEDGPQEELSKSKCFPNSEDETALNSPVFVMHRRNVDRKVHWKSSIKKGTTKSKESDNYMNIYERPLKETESRVLNADENIYEKHKNDTKRDQKNAGFKKACLFDNIDGWTTKHGPYTNQDNIDISLDNMSSSEGLHPVEAYSPTEYQKGSNDEKNAHKEAVNALECPSITKTYKDYIYQASPHNVAKPTLWNSPYLPHEKNYETNAFKYGGQRQVRPPVGKDRDSTNIGKLRLTSSCCETPKPSRNIPLSRSQSFKRQKKILSAISPINLSEKLASRLRDMRRVAEERPVTFNNSLSYSKSALSSKAGNHAEIKQKETADDSPNQTDPENSNELNEIHLSLPQIFIDRAGTPGNTDEKNREPLNPLILPPILGTSMGKFKKAFVDVPEDIINEYQYALSSVPDPAKNYVFERDYHMQAKRNYRNKGILCATCGGLKGIRIPDIPSKFRGFESDGVSLAETETEDDIMSITSESEDKARTLGNKYQAEKNKSRKKSGKKKSAKQPSESDLNDSKDTKVHIEYKDKDIQLTCEVTVTSSDKKKENSPRPNNDKDESSTTEIEENKTTERIDKIASTTPRELLESPVVKETRIHENIIGQGLFPEENIPSDRDSEEPTKNEIPTPSPYVEYCKRREKLRTSKKDIFTEEMVNFVSDTFIADLAQKVGISRFFVPVVPKHRSLDSLKRKPSKKNKPCPKSMSLISESNKTEATRKEFGLVVTPCPLPSNDRKKK